MVVGQNRIEYIVIYFINNLKSYNFYNDCWEHVRDCMGALIFQKFLTLVCKVGMTKVHNLQ